MAGVNELVGGDGEDDENVTVPGEDGRKSGRTKRMIPLSVPSGEPGRLVDMEESVIAAVRQLFDDVHALDVSIERAAKGVSELMATRIKKVGVDWQKHRRRPGRHPVVYRTGGKSGQRGRVAIASKRGSDGLPGAFVRRYWVEPIVPPVRLTMNAQGHELNSEGKVDPRSVALRAAQQDGLAILQQMIESRESALKALARLMQAIGMWRQYNRPSDAAEKPYDCGHTEVFLERTELLRQQEVTLSLARARAMEQLREQNERDDERRKDGAPKGPSHG